MVLKAALFGHSQHLSAEFRVDGAAACAASIGSSYFDFSDGIARNRANTSTPIVFVP